MAFQRETALELQEALNDTLRLVSRAFLEDAASSRAGTPWSKAMLGEELSESIRLSFRRVSILVERVENDTMRMRVKNLMTMAQLPMNARSENDAELHLMRCRDEADIVFVNLGHYLRATY